MFFTTSQLFRRFPYNYKVERPLPVFLSRGSRSQDCWPTQHHFFVLFYHLFPHLSEAHTIDVSTTASDD